MNFESPQATGCCGLGVRSGPCLRSSPLDSLQTLCQSHFSLQVNVELGLPEQQWGKLSKDLEYRRAHLSNGFCRFLQPRER